MGHMVLQLIAVTPEAQMFFSAAQMIISAAADPVIIRMCSRAIPPDPGQGFGRCDEALKLTVAPTWPRLRAVRCWRLTQQGGNRAKLTKN